LAELVLKITKSSSELEHRALPEDDPKQRRPDLSRAKTILNWEPQEGLASGIEKTSDWIAELIALEGLDA
jgi:nucleoside-diphosphate-sugar epimerase